MNIYSYDEMLKVKNMSENNYNSIVGEITSDDDNCSHNPDNRNVSEDDLYDLAELFKVFGDSTRIRIISALIDGELCVYHLSQRLSMGQSAISHQLRILRTAGLVRPRREGKEMYYSLDDEHVEQIFGAGLAHIIHKGGHSDD